MLKKVKKYCVIVFCLIVQNASSQEIKILPLVSSAHPRYVAGKDKKEIQKLIDTQAGAKEIYEQSKKGIDEYVNRHQTDSTWIVSRLMMFWKTKSTEIYIKGGLYDHAEGEAPGLKQSLVICLKMKTVNHCMLFLFHRRSIL